MTIPLRPIPILNSFENIEENVGTVENHWNFERRSFGSMLYVPIRL